MKTLVLVRHAKAEAEAAGGDRQRPLAPRGRHAAERMGRFLAEAGLMPELLLTSPARRAVETLDELAAAAGWGEVARAERPLYGIDTEQALAELRKVRAGITTLLAVGHEPTWSALAAGLVGGGRIHLATGAAVVVRVHCRRWSELAPGCGELLWLVPPKILD